MRAASVKRAAMARQLAAMVLRLLCPVADEPDPLPPDDQADETVYDDEVPF
jgi:hypothetical protein